MKKIFPIVLVILLSLNITIVVAQESPVMKYSGSITKEKLSDYVHSLASDTFEGRYTGSEGQHMAAEYIRTDFQKAGLDNPFPEYDVPAYFQTFSLDKCYWKEQELRSNYLSFEPGEDFVFLSNPENIDFSGKIVFAGYGIEDSLYSDYSGLDVKGKMVLVYAGEPERANGNYLLSGTERVSPKEYYFNKARLARKKGAEGLMMIAADEKDYKGYVRKLDNYLKIKRINYPGDTIRDNFFIIYASPEVATEIFGCRSRNLHMELQNRLEGKTFHHARFKARINVKTQDDCYKMQTENVIGMIEGTDLKTEAVVVIAHYDHLGKKDGKIYYGADDNASGTASLMALSEAFAAAEKNGLRPRRSLVFIAATGEELGLFGSRYYSEHPLFPIDSTYACVNIDMIGRVGRRYSDSAEYIAGWSYNSEALLSLAERNMKHMAPALEFKMKNSESVRGGSDYFYFAKNGVPSIFYFTGIHDDYHQPSDTPDKILYGRMQSTLRGIFSTIWELANTEENLKPDKSGGK